MVALAFVSRVRALKRWLHIQSMCQCFSKQNDKWHKRGGCYVVPRCRFLLICNWVPTTINQFSDTILEKLTQMQARNDSASLSLNQGDVQQTPSAEIQLCRNIWLWYRWKIWLWFLPSSWPSSLAHTHTHTHTYTQSLYAVTNTATQPPQCSAGGIWLGKAWILALSRTQRCHSQQGADRKVFYMLMPH